MKRSPLRRSTKPLARTARLARVSARKPWPKAGADPVYAAVDARSGGKCERCGVKATEHHHTRKPRRSHHRPELIAHLCHWCHARCSWPYREGRLTVEPMLDAPGRFVFDVIHAESKFAVRRTEE